MLENSICKYLIGAARVKFSVLDDIFRDVYIPEDYNIAMFVDMEAIMYRLYRPKDLAALSSVPASVMIRDVVVNIINVLAHYRRYFITRLHRNNCIFLLWNTKLSDYHSKVYPDYRKSQYDKYRPKNKDYHFLNVIMPNVMKFADSILAYVDGMYMIPNEKIDTGAAIAEIMSAKTFGSIYSIIFSRENYYNQLLSNTCSQLVGKRDNSYMITVGNCYSNGILKDHKTQASNKLTPNLLPHVWSLSSYGDIDLPKTKIFPSRPVLTRRLGKMLDNGEISADISIQSLLRILDVEDDEEVLNRYSAVSIPLSKASLSSSDRIKIFSKCVDLYDQEGLETINELLVRDNPYVDTLDLENLNMSIEYDDTFM